MRLLVWGTVVLVLRPVFLSAAAPSIPAPAGAAASDPAKQREAFATGVLPVLNRNCFLCHNADKPKRGLDLTRLETLIRGGKSGPPVVPGKPMESLLVRVLEAGHKPHMPPKKQLEAEEVEAVRRWVAGLPSDLSLEALARKGDLHWAFRPLERPAVPEVEDPSWARNPVDAFVLGRLEGAGLRPSPEAPRAVFLRRASLDLTGLPPAPEEVDAFLLDDSPRAFEKAVDRLLASAHYGERWGRHWLDLARFAESEGFKSDETRPHAWRYRDYVVRSLNEDKPFDRFIREQIAGDELWPSDPQARLATAFHRHYPDESNARDLFQRRQEILNDITDTVGQVFLGLTLGCARCHDHKYDPVSQRDYYRLQAFFANIRAVDDLVVAGEGDRRSHQEKLAVWEGRTRDIRTAMGEIEEKKRRGIAEDNFAKFPTEIQDAIRKSPAERTPLEWQMFYKAKPYLYPDREVLVNALGGEEKKRWDALHGQLDRFRDLDPGPLPLGSAIADAGRLAPATHVLGGGSHLAPGEEVEPGFPASLDARAPRIQPPAGLESSGRRSALADWLAAPGNPLTWRVLVNRLWHHHFGRGLVGTPSDFGALGEPPTHPELLDWLACELAEGGFRLKPIHRLIVLSRAYRQSSTFREEAARVDPENRLLWRWERSRLEGEAIRDSSLAVSGLLDPRVGGPSVFPELPAGVGGYGQWRKSVAEDANRRSIYIFVRRNLRYPLLEAFDFPDTHESCARRHATVAPTQALMLLNGKLSQEWARAFAGRLLREVGAEPAAWVGRGYRLAYSRSPQREEREAALAFLERQRALIAERILKAIVSGVGAALSDGTASGGTAPHGRGGVKAPGGKVALPADLPAGLDPALAAALVDFCHALLNSAELIDRN